MTTYRVNVHREGRWWIITVPDLDGYRTDDGMVNSGSTTQARRLADVETEARDFVCTVTDAAPSAVSLDVHIDIDGFDVTRESARLRDLRDQAARLDRELGDVQAALARRLAERNVPVRDIGTALGVSYQRAHQLVG